MDGIAIQATASRNTLPIGRSKGTNGPRKALANLTNVQKPKVVSFDNTCHKSVKKTSQLNRNIIDTPGIRNNKSFGIKPNKTRGKGTGNSIKIYEDAKPVCGKSIPLPESNYEVPESKEYMAPCTDRNFTIPLPEYLEKVMKDKPTYNISYFMKDQSDILPSEEYVANVCAECMSSPNSAYFSTTNKGKESDDGLPVISDLSLTDDFLFSDIHLLEEDEDLLLQVDSDESFSLESLDRELRSAGLDVPSW